MHSFIGVSTFKVFSMTLPVFYFVIYQWCQMHCNSLKFHSPLLRLQIPSFHLPSFYLQTTVSPISSNFPLSHWEVLNVYNIFNIQECMQRRKNIHIVKEIHYFFLDHGIKVYLSTYSFILVNTLGKTEVVISIFLPLKSKLTRR